MRTGKKYVLGCTVQKIKKMQESSLDYRQNKKSSIKTRGKSNERDTRLYLMISDNLTVK